MTAAGPEGRNWPWLLVVAALPLIVYSITVGYGFVWDDPIVVRQQLPYFDSLGDVLLPPRGVPQLSEWYYRPVVVASFLLDRAIWGEDPVGYHLTVVLAHALATAMVFLLGRAILGSSRRGLVAAVATAIIFGLHPVHVESVASIAGRSDVLALLFAAGALVLFLRARRARSVALAPLAATSFFLALMSKEAALGVLPLFPLLAWWRPGQEAAGATAVTSRGEPAPRRRRTRGKRGKSPQRAVRESTAARQPGSWPAWSWIPLAAALLVWWVLRARALSGGRPILFPELGVGESLLRVLGATGHYLRVSLLPTGIQGFWPDAPTAPALVALGALAWGTLLLLPLLVRRRAGLVIFCQLLFLGTVAPSLLITLSSLGPNRVADRYAYLPSLAVCLAAGFALGELAAWLERRPRSRWARAVTAAGALLAVAGLGLACARLSRPWRNPWTFWTAIARDYPDYGLPRLQLGRFHYEERRWAEAREAFEDAIRLRYNDAGRALARMNLASIAEIERDFPAAVEHSLEATRLRPTFAPAWYELARRKVLLARHLPRGDPEVRTLLEGAAVAVRRSLELDPNRGEARELERRLAGRGF